MIESAGPVAASALLVATGLHFGDVWCVLLGLTMAAGLISAIHEAGN